MSQVGSRNRGPGLQVSEERISLVRTVILLTLIPASWFGTIPVTRASVAAVVLLLGGYVILMTLGPRWLRVLQRVDLVVTLDILVVTLLVLISGTLHSPFVYLYYLVILEAAVRMNLRQALAASLAMAGVIILMWTQAGPTEALETIGFRLGAFIAGGFFLALFLGMLVQESRQAQERIRWSRVLDQRLREATAQLEEQLAELQFYNDLATKLSGALRVEDVLHTLLEAFLDTAGLAKGTAYAAGEDGTYAAASRGFAWAERDQILDTNHLPALPEGAAGGEIVIQNLSGNEPEPQVLTCMALVRAGHLRAWLCGLGAGTPDVSGVMRRRLRGVAAQGVSALEAARLYEEVQRMVSVDPTRALYPWSKLQSLVAEEIRRCTELVSVFSLAEIQVEDDRAARGTTPNDRDLALRRVITVLQGMLRRVDLLSHDGGGRFALLLPRMPKIQAVPFLREVLSRLEGDPIATQLLRVDRLLLSAGVVSFPEDGAAVLVLFDTLDGILARGSAGPLQKRPAP